MRQIGEAVVEILNTRKPSLWTVIGWTLFGLCALAYFAVWILARIGGYILKWDD